MSNKDWLPAVVGLPDRRKSAGYSEYGLIGRDSALAKLDSQLVEGARQIALTSGERAVTMHGQGGIGKTALAIEYCHKHTSRYQLIWWVNADSDTTISESQRALLTMAGIESDELKLRAQVRDLLRGVSDWLAVVDNAEDRKAFDRWNPNIDGGQILITSRSNQGWATTLEVELIEKADALDWLLKAAGMPTDTTEIAAAEELVTRLDGLALALTMATSLIAKSSLSKYLQWFNDMT